MPEYLFRGTTIGYEGGTTSQTYSFTCTSVHPIIALYFAMECSTCFPEQAVVYVANFENVKHHEAEANVLKKIEQECVLKVAPADFYPLTEGYIHYRDLQAILKEMGFDVTQVITKQNLTELCSKVPQLSPEEMESIMSRILAQLATN